MSEVGSFVAAALAGANDASIAGCWQSVSSGWRCKSRRFGIRAPDSVCYLSLLARSLGQHGENPHNLGGSSGFLSARLSLSLLHRFLAIDDEPFLLHFAAAFPRLAVGLMALVYAL